MSSIRVAIITVSDTAAQNPSKDESGPAIKQKIINHGMECVHTQIVPDEILAIREAVVQCVENQNTDWIITTGGTGLGDRDLTTDAIEPLLDRKFQGLVHLMYSISLKHTALAALANLVAGKINRTLVVCLPGSVKAVEENSDALLAENLLQHAIDLLRGGSGKKVHEELAEASQRGHDCHHHTPKIPSVLSHDPSAPASARHRESPYPLVSFQDALSLIEENVRNLSVETRNVDSHLRGYTLAASVRAPHNVPLTSTTNVDGYALRATDPPGIYKVVTPESHHLSELLPLNTIFRINTGAPLPNGTDAVIMIENTKVVSIFGREERGVLFEGEEKEVEILKQVSVLENVRVTGSDVRQGDLVLRENEVIRGTGGEVGSLIIAGHGTVKVFRKPVVALMSTGNEIVDINDPSPPASEEFARIYDTNRPSLQAALEGLGYQVVDLGIVGDDVNQLKSVLREGLSKADIIVTTGGTSMGITDYLKPVIVGEFKGNIHFGRVKVKPGKPTTFATIPFNLKNEAVIEKPIFALPGNPASALVTFYIFVVPALRLLGGWPRDSINLPRVRVKLQSHMPLDPRVEFHRVVIESVQGGLVAFSTGGQRSSRSASLSGANGFVILPCKTKEDPAAELKIGTMADALLFGELRDHLFLE